MVRAKFVCISKWSPENSDLTHVSFSPVTDGSEENKMFGNMTPAGLITLSVVPESTEEFIVGEQYYVDFTKVSLS